MIKLYFRSNNPAFYRKNKYLNVLTSYDCKISTEPTISNINSETNLPPPMINVVCKYLRQCLGTSFGVATLPVCCNIK